MGKAVLVVGGAGYIGAHVAYTLNQQGFQVIILDSFEHHQTISLPYATIINDSFGNPAILDRIFSTYMIDAVMHLAGYIEVGKSVIDPASFYHNNVMNTLVLLDKMREHHIRTIIFSSSCAVYGNPVTLPMNEEHQLIPESPYGKTKLAVEFMIQDYAQAYGMRYSILRYFNAAGALPEAHLGEQHIPETHIIPLLIRAVRDDKPFTIYGNDYATHDGTCIRDYVHVKDIASAHVKAYKYLLTSKKNQTFNLGTGRGYSIKELIDTAQAICKRIARVEYAPRRAGDVPILIADPAKAERILHWEPTHSDITDIFSSVYLWEQDRLQRIGDNKEDSIKKKKAQQASL
jgi:UDP-glucose 4-epimerase